jgi:membrane protein
MLQHRFGTRLEERAAPETTRQMQSSSDPQRPEWQPWSGEQRRSGEERRHPAEPRRLPEQRRSEQDRRSPDRRYQQDRAPQPERFSWRPKPIYHLLRATYAEWSKDKVPRMGAALAYYTIFSLAPLLVIAIAIAGFVFGANAVQGQIMGQIQGLVGSESARAVQTMIQSAHRPAHGIVATIFGLAVLLLGASGVFSEMHDALNTIWKVDTTSKTGVWNLIKGRFLSFGMVLGIGFLLLVSLLLSAALTAVATYASGFLPIPPTALHAVDFVFSLVFIAGLMALIFKFLPDVRISWSDVWIGAALTSLLFTAGKFLIGFYIGHSVTMSAYGAAGSVVIILAWIYYSALILYFGAEFTRVYSARCGSHCSPEAKHAVRAANAA